MSTGGSVGILLPTCSGMGPLPSRPDVTPPLNCRRGWGMLSTPSTRGLPIQHVPGSPISLRCRPVDWAWSRLPTSGKAAGPDPGMLPIRSPTHRHDDVKSRTAPAVRCRLGLVCATGTRLHRPSGPQPDRHRGRRLDGSHVADDRKSDVRRYDRRRPCRPDVDSGMVEPSRRWIREVVTNSGSGATSNVLALPEPRSPPCPGRGGWCGCSGSPRRSSSSDCPPSPREHGKPLVTGHR